MSQAADIGLMGGPAKKPDPETGKFKARSRARARTVTSFHVTFHDSIPIKETGTLKARPFHSIPFHSK